MTLEYAASDLKPSRWRRALAVLILGYAPLVLISLYATWIAGWCVLGHAPQPSLDDPKFIGGVCSYFYASTCLLIMGLAFVLCGSIAAIALTAIHDFRRGKALQRDSWWGLATVFTWVLCIVIWVWDPLRVMDWFMD